MRLGKQIDQKAGFERAQAQTFVDSHSFEPERSRRKRFDARYRLARFEGDTLSVASNEAQPFTFRGRCRDQETAGSLEVEQWILGSGKHDTAAIALKPRRKCLRSASAFPFRMGDDKGHPVLGLVLKAASAFFAATQFVDEVKSRMNRDARRPSQPRPAVCDVFNGEQEAYQPFFRPACEKPGPGQAEQLFR